MCLITHVPNTAKGHSKRAMSDLSPVQRVNILGLGVSAIHMEQALSIIERWVAGRDPHYVCCADVNVIMHGYRDAELRHIYNHAGLLTPDGMPLVWWSRRTGQPHVTRVYGPDLMLALCASGHRHFLYGSTTQVLDKLTAQLRARLPAVAIVGSYAPPFRPLTEAEDAEVCDLIANSRADVVWVGLGTPKQDHWMAGHVGKVSAPVLIGVGAAFDFLSGSKPQAPLWMQRRGLEWLFRLATEPRRLWKRFAINIPHFMWLTLLQHLRLRDFPLNER
jgi:N-acetylglucosaminyldiphosphoundecaprenol N-acetyl-beta-D-mannosaminyltransferase